MKLCKVAPVHTFTMDCSIIYIYLVSIPTVPILTLVGDVEVPRLKKVKK